MIVNAAFNYLSRVRRPPLKSNLLTILTGVAAVEVREVDSSLAPEVVTYRDAGRRVVIRSFEGRLYGRQHVPAEEDHGNWLRRTLEAQPIRADPFGRIEPVNAMAEDAPRMESLGFEGETAAELRAREIQRLASVAIMVDGAVWKETKEPRFAMDPMPGHGRCVGRIVTYESGNSIILRLDDSDVADRVAGIVAGVDVEVTLPEVTVIDPSALRYPAEEFALRLAGFRLMNEMTPVALDREKAFLCAYADLRDACWAVDPERLPGPEERHALGTAVAEAIAESLTLFDPTPATREATRASIARWEISEARYRTAFDARMEAEETETSALSGMAFG